MPTTPFPENVAAVRPWLKVRYHALSRAMWPVYSTANLFEQMFGSGPAKIITVGRQGGSTFRYPRATGRGASFGYSSSGQPLAVAQAASRDYLEGWLKFSSSRRRIEGLAQALSQGAGDNSFADTMDDITREMPLDFARFSSDAAIRDSYGCLSRISAISGSTFTVYPNHSIGEGSNTSLGTFGVDQLYKNMEISFWNDGTRTGTGVGLALADFRGLAANNRVTGINRTTRVVTCEDAISGSVLVGDFVTWKVQATTYLPGTQSVSASGGTQLAADTKEINGLLAHISSTGTVDNVNKATDFDARPAVDAGTEGADLNFSWDDVDDDIAAITHEVGADRVDEIYIVTRPKLSNKAYRLIQGTTHAAMGQQTKKWGFKSIEYDRVGVHVTWFEMPEAPGGTILYIIPGLMRYHQAFPPMILDTLDGLPWKPVADHFSAEVQYGAFRELVQPNWRFAGIHRGYSET